MLKIKDILTKKGPHFNIVTPDTKVLDALTLMKAENLSYVVVMKDDQYLGLMSERDYTHKIKLEGRQSETATVKDIMTTNYPVIGYSDDLERCMVLMNVYKTRYLPVFDEMEFKGILTMNDLMREVIDKK
jgi:CBS domain-containing protein